MTHPVIGQPAPDFALPSGRGEICLSALRGGHVVPCSHPRDDTPGCTAEPRKFRDHAARFAAANAVALGVSRGSRRRYEKFRSRHSPGFDLVSDCGEVVCRLHDVIRDRKRYGRSVRGIGRSTFVIDTGGIPRREWRGLNVPGHVSEVLAVVRGLP